MLKKTIPLLLLLLCLLLPISAQPDRIPAGTYHASAIDYLLLYDAADGSQVAQFLATDGLGNETFSLTALWNGFSGSLVRGGQTITLTAHMEDSESFQVTQDTFLFDDVSGYYFPVTAGEEIAADISGIPAEHPTFDISESAAILLLEHHPALKDVLGDHPQWTIAPRGHR